MAIAIILVAGLMVMAAMVAVAASGLMAAPMLDVMMHMASIMGNEGLMAMDVGATVVIVVPLMDTVMEMVGMVMARP